MRRHGSPLAPLSILGLLALSAVGCTLWPFRDRERVAVITPAMRAASIREMGPRADESTEAEQLAMCEELAQQIRTEPDPIVRRAIQETIAEFDVPLASAVLLAGLNDEDRDVRTACCRLLGVRQDPAAIGPLSRLVGAEPEAEVRMAAIDALGQFHGPAAVQGLAAAIKDRDPALQFAGVQAMKRASGEDLGNDVEAWREYAASLPATGSPAVGGEVSIAREPGAQPTIR
jgi:HEAT repeat protein